MFVSRHLGFSLMNHNFIYRQPREPLLNLFESLVVFPQLLEGIFGHNIK